MEIRETPLEHYGRHPRTFLDVYENPDDPGLRARCWCLDCDYEVELSEDAAEEWAERGVPWRTGTE